MAACEKCWGDAYFMTRFSGKDQSECYSILLKERADNPCTPEEQAGENATRCPKCMRNTVHQYAHVCMICNFKEK